MASGLPGLCEERARLLNLYREAAAKYAEAVRAMADLAGAGLHSEVEVLRRACRAAWDQTEQARVALFRHEADHQCDRQLRRLSNQAGAF